MAGSIFYGKGINRKTGKEISFSIPERFTSAGVEKLRKNAEITELTYSYPGQEPMFFNRNDSAFQILGAVASMRERREQGKPPYLTGPEAAQAAIEAYKRPINIPASFRNTVSDLARFLWRFPEARVETTGTADQINPFSYRWFQSSVESINKLNVFEGPLEVHKMPEGCLEGLGLYGRGDHHVGRKGDKDKKALTAAEIEMLVYRWELENLDPDKIKPRAFSREFLENPTKLTEREAHDLMDRHIKRLRKLIE